MNDLNNNISEINSIDLPFTKNQPYPYGSGKIRNKCMIEGARNGILFFLFCVFVTEVI